MDIEVELGSHVVKQTVFCFSFSQRLVLWTLSLYLKYFSQLLEERVAGYTSCLALASSPSAAKMSAENDIVQEMCESRGGRPELSVLSSLLVSVDVKNY